VDTTLIGIGSPPKMYVENFAIYIVTLSRY